MLAAIIYLYNRAQTFDYSAILELLASGRLSRAAEGRRAPVRIVGVPTRLPRGVCGEPQ